MDLWAKKRISTSLPTQGESIVLPMEGKDKKNLLYHRCKGKRTEIPPIPYEREGRVEKES
jgi:hypothetical protein